jgi:hypothetical protein
MSRILKIENKGMVVSSVFFAIVGVLFLALLPLNDFAPHLGLLAVFSLGAAYGLLTRRTWSLWLVVILFTSGTAFAAFMIYSGFMNELLISLVMIAYLVLTWIFTIYVVAKREVLKG